MKDIVNPIANKDSILNDVWDITRMVLQQSIAATDINRKVPDEKELNSGLSSYLYMRFYCVKLKKRKRVGY